MTGTGDQAAERWITLAVSADGPESEFHPIHRALLELATAYLRGEVALVDRAAHEFREALGARAMIIEQIHDGVRERFESGDVVEPQHEHTVLVDIGDEWFGSVSVDFEGDPSTLERWALSAAADLLDGRMRRQRATEQLERTLAERDRFVASVGHEVRTPLAAVLGLAEEVRDGFDSLGVTEARELIGIIADQSKEVASIMEDLIAVTATDRPGFVVRTERTRLDEVVRAAVASVPAVARSGLVLRRIESIHAICDPLRTRQIVRNLITNARRHGGDRAFLDVTATRDGGAVVTVADSGGPIPEPIQAAMFEPYASSHRSEGDLASLGLGLTVSRQLARAMGGDLIYRSDGESRFELHFPRPSV